MVDLSNKKITRMKTTHSNVGRSYCKIDVMLIRFLQICSSVKFVPDRSSEIISGGYDSALIHFDYKQNVVLSRFDIGE